MCLTVWAAATGRPADVEGAGRPDRLGALVAVEAGQHRLGHQAQVVQDGLDLEAERRVLLAEAVAQHHPAEVAVPQAGGRP